MVANDRVGWLDDLVVGFLFSLFKSIGGVAGIMVGLDNHATG